MSLSEFTYVRPISYYETDAMGVVHHSNFIRLFEDARVAWLRHRGLEKVHTPQSEIVFAVIEAQCNYLRPLRFGDMVRVRIQAQSNGVRIRFRYAVYKNQDCEVASTGLTLHVAVDLGFRVTKPPEDLMAILKEEQWTEIWP